MPRSFDMAAEFEGSVEQVHRAFGDEQYWLERLADSGADDYSLDSMTVNGEGIDVVTTATVKGAITGAPATLSGTGLLAPAKSGAGSRLEFNASVEVKVPLVGGKIENFIGSALVDLLIAEQRFTTVWITENA